jgi:hypothetical protein
VVPRRGQALLKENESQLFPLFGYRAARRPQGGPMIARRLSASAFVVALATLVSVAGCNASTAHIASLNVANDKAATSSTETFAPNDEIFASGHVANLPNKVTMQWQMIAEDVKGEPKNEHIAALDKSYDVNSDADVTYNLTPPPNGWPAGKYKIVLTMMDNGSQRDEKSQEFAVGAAGKS